MLIPHREPGVEEDSLPWDYQRVITAVRQAAGPVMAREVGEAVGGDASVKAKLEPLRSKLVRVVDRGWLRKLPDGRFTTRLCPATPLLGTARHRRNQGVPGGRWNCVTNTEELAEDTFPLVYQCRLALSTRTVSHLDDLLRRHLKAIRSWWRILPPGRIAVIVLAALRHDQRLADMAGGNDVSESTVRRWRDQLIGLLAAQAPQLERALKKVAKQGGEVVLIDGTLIRTQRRTGKADRGNHSGKHRTHDTTDARHDHILAHLRAAGLGARADLGFRGLDNDTLDPVIVTGYTASRTHKLTPGEKEANRVLAVGRAPVEHGFAHIKNWRSLTKLRTDPAWATQLLRALHVLTKSRSQPLTDDLLRGLTPTTSTSTPRTDQTSPLNCDFKLTEAQGSHHRHLAAGHTRPVIVPLRGRARPPRRQSRRASERRRL